MLKSGLWLPPIYVQRGAEGEPDTGVVIEVLQEGLITGLIGTDPVYRLPLGPYKRQWQVCDRSGR